MRIWKGKALEDELIPKLLVIPGPDELVKLQMVEIKQVNYSGSHQFN
jgi:hypothetical protein